MLGFRYYRSASYGPKDAENGLSCQPSDRTEIRKIGFATHVDESAGMQEIVGASTGSVTLVRRRSRPATRGWPDFRRLAWSSWCADGSWNVLCSVRSRSRAHLGGAAENPRKPRRIGGPAGAEKGGRIGSLSGAVGVPSQEAGRIPGSGDWFGYSELSACAVRFLC